MSIYCAVRQFVVLFQDQLYQVPLKWEPENQFLHWGEYTVMCTTHTVSLTLKGVPPVNGT